MAFDSSNVFPTAGVGNVQGANRFQGAFPDPYLDYASTQMPRSIYDVFRWSEFIWLTYGTYRMACQRVVRYFLTKVELTDASDDEKEKYEKFLDNDLRIMNVLATAGDNRMCYGNEFTSLSVPFRRYLRCPKCFLERPISHIAYSWVQWEFHATCGNPKCKYKGVMERIDRRSMDMDPIRVVHWSPQEIRILYHPVTGKTAYFWEIPGNFKHMIKTGNTFYLENTAWELIEAIKKDNHLFRFHDDVLYHMKDDTVAGVRNYGWGIPLIMANFKMAWYIQVLRRYNEAIALDYIIPFRVITPKAGSSKEADPVLHMNLNLFYSRVMQMFRQHRKDPTSIHALPFAIELQMLGAEGKALAPTDLMDKATDEFLNAQGVPAELYRGTLQLQAMPTALRLFERTWTHLVSDFNGLINWLFKRVSELKNWESLKGRLQPVTLADNLEDKQVRLQLAAGQQISKQTALAPFGINVREEIKRQMQEEQYMQEEMAKMQEDQEQKQQLQQTLQQGAMGQQPGMQQPGMPPGQPGQPGQPQGDPSQMQQGGQVPMQPGMMGGGMGGGQGAGVTPEDLTAQAEQIAYQLLTMPYEARRSQLLQIKKSNETLHSIVIAKMEQIRNQAKNQGGQQVLQQMGGQG